MEKPDFFQKNKQSSINLEIQRLERVAKIHELVNKINESGENLPFPGITPEAYLKMKKTDDEFPGYTTPTDEIIKRCNKEGIKIILGKYSDSGNVFVLPTGSDDIKMDSISPHQLDTGAVANKHLCELIELTTKKQI